MKLPVPPSGSSNPDPQPESPRAENDDAATGLPWPTTWRGVYVLVIGCFLLWITLLATLSKVSTSGDKIQSPLPRSDRDSPRRSGFAIRTLLEGSDNPVPTFCAAVGRAAVRGGLGQSPGELL